MAVYSYNDVQKLNNLSSSFNSDINFLNKIFNHFIIGLEFGKSKFKIRGGYNAKRRQELKNDAFMAFSGFSWGVGLHLYDIEIDYARSTYHIHGSPNYITVSTSLDKIFNKNKAQ